MRAGGRAVSKYSIIPSGDARETPADINAPVQNRPETGARMFDPASKEKQPRRFPSRARANPPTPQQEPRSTHRYDAITPPLRAGMKKMPTPVRAVIPHPEPCVGRKMPRTPQQSRGQKQAVLEHASRSPRSSWSRDDVFAWLNNATHHPPLSHPTTSAYHDTTDPPVFGGVSSWILAIP
ncbi:hypothetical protein T484DRAFT_1897263 [Baffinella frigidus]|nr:hypothetical protein T484DRAFT_1897263 [Cryptophyta sp. CCMP2293]